MATKRGGPPAGPPSAALGDSPVVAMDIVEPGFELLCWVPPGQLERLTLEPGQLLPWFADRPPALIFMSAIDSAHRWGRELLKLGHAVRLLPPAKVCERKAGRNVQAIWDASRRAGMRFLPVRSESEQVEVSLFRLRAQLKKMHLDLAGEMHRQLADFGLAPPPNLRGLRAQLPAMLQQAATMLPAPLVESLGEQLDRIRQLEADIAAIERRLK